MDYIFLEKAMDASNKMAKENGNKLGIEKLAKNLNVQINKLGIYIYFL